MTEQQSQSLTPEQHLSRVETLERMTDIAARYTARHRQQLARIGAVTRAIARDQTSDEDRDALLDVLDQIAHALILETELQIEQLRCIDEAHV
jgi:hypothetical protein